MNLYFVQRTDKIGLDQYDSFVCAAEDRAQALAMKPHESVRDGDGTWSDNVVATPIGVASDLIFAEPVVILASFNAA